METNVIDRVMNELNNWFYHTKREAEIIIVSYNTHIALIKEFTSQLGCTVGIDNLKIYNIEVIWSGSLEDDEIRVY